MMRSQPRWYTRFANPFAMLVACTAATAVAQPPADQPQKHRDENSRKAHTQLLEKAKTGQIDVYFVGDSITRRWGATDYPQLLANWRENFFGWNAANFAWGGDSTQHILWRLQNGELDGLHPKVIVILAGTNNVGNRPGNEAKVADVTRGIQAILDTCRTKAPQATIILTAIFPRSDNIEVMPTIRKINENISLMADGKSVRFINVNGSLTDPEGKLLDGMTVDGLHPSLKAYQVWADALKPLFTELLGPPAEEDFAPPATGDPDTRSSRKTLEHQNQMRFCHG